MAMTILGGIVAGLIGGVVVAILMMAMSRGKPGINAMLVARATGKKPEESMMGGTAAHFFYSAVVGILFVVGSGILHVDSLLGLGDRGFWVNGLLYGGLLFLIAGMVVMPLAGVTRAMRQSMPKGQMAMSFVVHILFGLILVASLTWIPVG